MPSQIYIASDHAGFLLKEHLISWLQDKGYTVYDKGCSSRESCDYPDYASLVAEAVASDRETLGILVCGTGIGMSIAANKHPGVRAALCHDTYSAHLARAHNDSNVLCLGANCIGPGIAEAIVHTWLQSSFLGDRHMRRVSKISVIESRRPGE